MESFFFFLVLNLSLIGKLGFGVLWLCSNASVGSVKI